MKKIILVIIFLCVAFSAHASKIHGRLTPEDIERVKAFKGLVHEVDAKSVHQTVAELEQTSHPLLNLEIKEAMAKAYADIVREQKVVGLKNKEWLYSMVGLNMAYLQFGGSKNAEPLNKLICQKLKAYLPANIVNAQGFHFSLD